MGLDEDIGPCLIYPGRKNKRGYGITPSGQYAHRVAFFEAHGYFPEVVRYRCDNPPCVQLNHLEPGTQADNLQDAIDRGRARRAQGTDVATSKLTWPQVRAIREALASDQPPTIKGLAKKYGVDRHTIRKIRDGLTWTAEPKREGQ